MRSILALPVVALVAACATTNPDLPTQPDVDLSLYAGTWYEQARLPNRFQKDCAGDVQADYTLRADGLLTVVNQCRTHDGAVKSAEGEGRLSTAVDKRDPAKLEVRFAPEWTSWLPVVWGDYWIMKLRGDYEYSLVGTPDRKYLWVLSRQKQADPAVVDALLNHASSQGFATDAVVKTGN